MNKQILKILLFYFPDSPEEKRAEAAKLLTQLEDEVLHSRKSSFVAAREALESYYRREGK